MKCNASDWSLIIECIKRMKDLQAREIIPLYIREARLNELLKKAENEFKEADDKEMWKKNAGWMDLTN